MPAMLDDPAAPVIYRVSGDGPFPNPQDFTIPMDIVPHQVTLRDRITTATLLPFTSADQVPHSLLAYLSDQFAREIELGDTYPMMQPLALSEFGAYWFQNFATIMILGPINSIQELADMEASGNADWNSMCLGSFYVKPNYPGRSSHICNGGFLVTDASRNRGVGRLMGECYLQWAPKLGYSYSVFNLVYETNVASLRIWDSLGFKRIGRVPKCGNLRSHPDEFVDAIIYGRELGPEGEDFVSEERFQKIRYYLKHGKYPNGADRAEKSRLRSAATHYKLLPALYTNSDGTLGEERLMLKDKEVISDPQRQYEISRETHTENTHSGINKTTAAIAEKYHWVRIKETVSLVIKNCQECKDQGKPQANQPFSGGAGQAKRFGGDDMSQGIERLVRFDQMQVPAVARQAGAVGNNGGNMASRDTHDYLLKYVTQGAGPQPVPASSAMPRNNNLSPAYDSMPLDPQIMHGPNGMVQYDMTHIDNFLNLPRQAHENQGVVGDGMSHEEHPFSSGTPGSGPAMHAGFSTEQATVGGGGGESGEAAGGDEVGEQQVKGQGRKTRAARKSGDAGDQLMSGL